MVSNDKLFKCTRFSNHEYKYIMELQVPVQGMHELVSALLILSAEEGI